MDRFHARLSRFSRRNTRFTTDPEPRTIGSVARGRLLAAGHFQFAGHLIEDKAASLWELEAPDQAWHDEVGGFLWLDDLAAAGSYEAAERARDWAEEWLTLYGAGFGPGWRPSVAGRRVVRLINHSVLLQAGWDDKTKRNLIRIISQHVVFLSRRWRATTVGQRRFEALAGMLYGAVSLDGLERYADPASRAIARECEARIGPDGAIPSRNPEELLEIFSLLTLCAAALSEDGRIPSGAHLEAMQRIAPALRTLRHADGGLARFHGGGRGAEGRLDHALAASGVRATAKSRRAMGFVRLTGGRTTVIQDAAPPPDTGLTAHASTLAFELTSGRRPLIVNCGSGVQFGPEWHRVGRATQSHSTLALEGHSSSRITGKGLILGQTREKLSEGPSDVRLQQDRKGQGTSALTGHNGYQMDFGLTHVRRLILSADGRTLSGEDTLAALSDADRRRLVRARERIGSTAIPFAVRFHLNPDVEAEIDASGTKVAMSLANGEIWVFRHEGAARLTIEPSSYLERGRLKPRPTRQIVLAAEITDDASQLGWTLGKAEDTPTSVRDLRVDEPVYDI